MNDGKQTIREKFRALPTSAKVGVGLASAAGAAGLIALGWKLFGSGGESEPHGHGRDRHAGHAPPPEGTSPPGSAPASPSAAAPPQPPGSAGPVASGPTPTVFGAGFPGAYVQEPTFVVVGEPPPLHVRRGSPLRTLLVRPAPPMPIARTSLVAQRDIGRLLADIRRARRRGDLVLGAAPGANENADLAKLSFELGAYVAEALMARGIVVQMPDVPPTSAIEPGMTEKDGEAAFQALVDATDGPLDSAGLEALRDLRSSSGVKFWAVPGTDKRVVDEVEAAKARRAGSRA